MLGCGAMSMTVYQYPKCSTCRKALKWLDAHGVKYQAIDLVADPPSKETLRDLHARSGLPIARFFNTSGESYRAGNFKAKLATLSEADALAALARDGKLIKRPIVDTGPQGPGRLRRRRLRGNLRLTARGRFRECWHFAVMATLTIRYVSTKVVRALKVQAKRPRKVAA